MTSVDHLELWISPQILKQIWQICEGPNGMAWGNGFMKKTWSRKCPDTVTVNWILVVLLRSYLIAASMFKIIPHSYNFSGYIFGSVFTHGIKSSFQTDRKGKNLSNLSSVIYNITDNIENCGDLQEKAAKSYFIPKSERIRSLALHGRGAYIFLWETEQTWHIL